MAIESTFYDTSAAVPASLVTEIKWADSHPHVGSSDYGVVGVGDFAVTTHPSTPYALNVAPGKAWGHGVFDESDATEVVTADPPAGGTRWDLVALRRNWGPLAGGPTSLTVVQGGTIEEIPANRQNVPGTIDDQPLYLVQWTSGQSQPTALIDVRCWAGNGGMFARSKHVRSYLNRIGSSVQFSSGEHWTYEIGANDLTDWVKRDTFESAANVTTLGMGWENSLGFAYFPRVRRSGNIVHLYGGLRRVVGEFSDILTVPPDFRPIDTRNQFVGSGCSSRGIAYQIALSGGKLWIPLTYMTGYPTQPEAAYPLTASWPII